MTLHTHSQHRIRIAAPADAAFMFFTPRGEELWVDGWKPAYLHPLDGATTQGMVFTTGSGDEHTIWYLARFDRAARESLYVRTTPASRTGSVAIACRPLDAGSTEVTVTYAMTAIGTHGAATLAPYEGTAFAAMIDGWAESIGRRLPALLQAKIA